MDINFFAMPVRKNIKKKHNLKKIDKKITKEKTKKSVSIKKKGSKVKTNISFDVEIIPPENNTATHIKKPVHDVKIPKKVIKKVPSVRNSITEIPKQPPSNTLETVVNFEPQFKQILRKKVNKLKNVVKLYKIRLSNTKKEEIENQKKYLEKIKELKNRVEDQKQMLLMKERKSGLDVKKISKILENVQNEFMVLQMKHQALIRRSFDSLLQSKHISRYLFFHLLLLIFLYLSQIKLILLLTTVGSYIF